MLTCRRYGLGRMLLALAVLLPLAAAASSAGAATVAEVAAYGGADREQRLVAGAKQERTLSVYTSLTTQDVGALIKGYEETYGVQVKLWRGSSEQVVQRVVAETRAGRNDVDVILTNGPGLEALHREGLLQKIVSPAFAKLIPQALQPHGEWTGTQLNVFISAYNTNLVSQGDLPKRYADLVDPKWKGKLAVEAEDADWFASVVTDLGVETGLKTFREIVKSNGMSVRKGHTLLAQLVAAGEVPLALTVHSFSADQLKNEGAPLDWFAIPPAMARPNGEAVLRGSPHPNAALLFYDFVLGAGQPILIDRGFVTVRNDFETVLSRFPYKFVDPRIALDEGEKWQKLYQEIMQPR
jgi:iron(III) transport system substrate-binding protein